MKLECCYVQLPKIYKHLNGNEFKVFTVIFDEWSMMKNEDGWFYRSLKNLCEDTRLSDRTLRDILKNLSEKGVILTTSYNDGVKNATYNKANEYKINMEKVIELSNEKVVKITTSKGCQNENEKVVKNTTSKGCQNENEKVVKNTKEGGKNYQPTKEEKTKEKIINNITTVNTVPVPIEKEKINKNINISTGLKKEKVETSTGQFENNFNFNSNNEADMGPVETEPNKNNNLNSNNMEKTNMVPLKTDEKQSETVLTSLATALDKKEIIKEKAAAPLAAAAKSQETQNKPHDGLKNDAVGSCSTNDEKTQHEARKYVETLTQRIYHEKNVENFKKLHDEYIAEMKNYKARYGTDNFVIKQKKWYRATRPYFPKKKIDSNIICYFGAYKDNFKFVTTANQLKQKLDSFSNFMEKIENEGYDVEKLRPDYNRFISSQKRNFKNIWGTWD